MYDFDHHIPLALHVVRISIAQSGMCEVTGKWANLQASDYGVEDLIIYVSEDEVTAILPKQTQR